MEIGKGAHSDLATQDLGHFREIRQRFEEAYQRGEQPQLEEYLPAEEGEQRWATLIELIHVDLRCRLERGEAVRVEQYLQRFSEIQGNWSELLSLIAAEYGLRRSKEPALRLEEYRERFPQCPELSAYLQEGGHRAELPSEIASSTCTDFKMPASFSAVASPPGADLFRPETLGYDILGELGRGGMGIVYRAYHRQRDQVVALKTLQGMDAGALYRFKQEFRTLAGVVHPNLVSLYDLISDGRSWFFTMEFVPGVDFRTYVCSADPGGPFHESRLRESLRQLVEGIVALHEAGKLHRDIKPRNVLVTTAGRVVLLDFGLSTELDQGGLHQSTECHLLGTLAYMSPEQAAGGPVSAASDLYNLGVMLYETLTGRFPFEGNALEVLRAKEHDNVRPPSRVISGIPPDLDRLCIALLQRDPRARPSGREVLRRLGHASQEQAEPCPMLEHLPRGQFLVGRQPHLAALEDAFATTRRGKPVMLFVHGRSGVGKSALLQHFLNTIQLQDGVVVLSGRCYEHELVPYKAMDSLVDSLSRHLRHLPLHEAESLLPRGVLPLVRVFPVLLQAEAIAMASERVVEVPDPQELRRRAFTALRELLARLGDHRPLVLAIDDLQWGDLDSAALLAELLRPPEPPVFLFLGCYRSEDAEKSPFLRALLQFQDKSDGSLDRRQLPIEALSPADARTLARKLLEEQGEVVLEQVEAIQKESGGNPFFVHELVQYLKTGTGLRERAKGSKTLALDEVLWNRVSRLPEEAQRLLEVIAVAGQPLCIDLLCQAADLGAKGHDMSAVLQASRFIRSTSLGEEDEIETYHDRVRETVTAHLSHLALTRCHHRLAEVLEAWGQADAEALAIHFHQAEQWRQAGRYYAAAAAQAAKILAFDRAAKLYRLALSLDPGERARERELRTQLASALANAGRGADAAKEYLVLTTMVGGPEALDFRCHAATQLITSGHIEEGFSLFNEVLRSVGLRIPPTPRRALLLLVLKQLQLRLRGLHVRLRAEVDLPREKLFRADAAWSIATGISLYHPIFGAYFLAIALLDALRLGEPNRIARALSFEAALTSVVGSRGSRRSARLFAMAESLSNDEPHPRTRASIVLSKGVTAFLQGRWKDCPEYCRQAEQLLRDHCVGAIWERDTARIFRLWALNHLGEYAALMHELPRAIQDCRERGELYALTSIGSILTPIISLVQDDPEGASRDLQTIMEGCPRRGFFIQHYKELYSQLQIDLYRGRAVDAWNKISQSWPWLVRSLLLRVQVQHVLIRHARARCAVAAAAMTPDKLRLLQCAGDDAHRLRQEKVPWATALAVLVEAGIASTRNEKSHAVRVLRDALERLEAVQMQAFAAAARYCLGNLLGGEEGNRHLRQAHAWMESQGIKNPRRMAMMLAPGVLAQCGDGASS
jgi:serine/threonine protein kinase